ncbi:hypothetical protein T31B1_06255 [Salinisphaera sp. T31B1]
MIVIHAPIDRYVRSPVTAFSRRTLDTVGIDWRGPATPSARRAFAMDHMGLAQLPPITDYILYVFGSRWPRRMGQRSGRAPAPETDGTMLRHAGTLAPARDSTSGCRSRATCDQTALAKVCI